MMNGQLWHVKITDSNSPMLVDRTGEKRVATTDPRTHRVYLSNELDGEFLTTVLIHELGHCVMFSYGLIDEIHMAVHPDYWLDAEEWICNFIAEYGLKIFSTAHQILGDEAWSFIPYELELLIA